MKLNNNKNIFCSVSSGYSSVLMAIKIKQWYPNHNIIFAMANTSKERTESLNFMNKCDKYYNLNLTWIEAIFNDYGKGVSFNVVEYKDLKTKGEIFEDGIKKLGIPSKINKWCNRDMKLVPLRKYANSVFGLDNYSIAVGLRIDEVDRISKKYKTNNIFYPLIDRKVNKMIRNFFWNKEVLKLGISAFEGNCDLCFEKSDRKLITIISKKLNLSIWWDEMIKKHGQTLKKNSESYNDLLKENNGMTFYREYKTINDLINLSKQPFKIAADEYIFTGDPLDKEDDCGSGCTVFN